MGFLKGGILEGKKGGSLLNVVVGTFGLVKCQNLVQGEVIDLLAVGVYVGGTEAARIVHRGARTRNDGADHGTLNPPSHPPGLVVRPCRSHRSLIAIAEWHTPRADAEVLTAVTYRSAGSTHGDCILERPLLLLAPLLYLLFGLELR